MNSHRDNVKDAIRLCLDGIFIDNEVDEVVHVFADTVFNALGITRDEQDKCGGYFMLHAEKWQWEKTMPNDGYKIGIDLAEVAENEYTRRTKELAEGAKYTREEFKSYAVGNVLGNPCIWNITLQTPIRKYYQAYGKHIVLEEAKAMFVSLYYPMYLADYERSIAVDKMDEE